MNNILSCTFREFKIKRPSQCLSDLDGAIAIFLFFDILIKNRVRRFFRVSISKPLRLVQPQKSIVHYIP